MSRVEKYSQGKEVILVAVSPLIKRTLNTLGPARSSYSILGCKQEPEVLKEIGSNLRCFQFPFAFFFDTLSGLKMLWFLKEEIEWSFFTTFFSGIFKEKEYQKSIKYLRNFKRKSYCKKRLWFLRFKSHFSNEGFEPTQRRLFRNILKTDFLRSPLYDKKKTELIKSTGQGEKVT